MHVRFHMSYLLSYRSTVSKVAYLTPTTLNNSVGEAVEMWEQELLLLVAEFVSQRHSKGTNQISPNQ